MKKIHFFLALFFMLSTANLFSQSYYDQQWKKIQSNYEKGQYKSNLSLILEIQNRAKKEGNIAELIKSLKSEYAILSATHDDTQNNSVSQFFAKIEKEEKELKDEQKSLLSVLKNYFLLEYYGSHSWQIDRRTPTADAQSPEMETWSKLNFKNAIEKNFIEFEKQTSQLQNIDLEKYKSIFENTESRYFVTLWDWNAYQNILFLNHSNFFTKNERKKNQKKIEELYKALIAKNSGNSKLYFQHQELNFLCENQHCTDKNSLLEKLYSSEVQGDYKVVIVEEIMKLLREKKPKDALAWADRVRKEYPKSKFLNNIKNIENLIKNPEAHYRFEPTVLANTPVHISVASKNISKVSLELFKVIDVMEFMRHSRNYYHFPMADIKKEKIGKFDFDLNRPVDYQFYKTSLKLPALPPGIYTMKDMLGKNQTDDADLFFYVSDYKLLNTSTSDEDFYTNEHYWVNAKNGKFAKNEPLKVYYFIHQKNIQTETVTTNALGAFKFPKIKGKVQYGQVNIFIQDSKGNGYNTQYYLDDYRKKTQNEQIAQYKTQIFLDRKIYRPGQVVYFKVITTKKEGEKEAVVAQKTQKVNLKDTNYKMLETQELITNEFGSYSGRFVLPKGKLNGRFTIEVQNADRTGNSAISFSVEEYKRPTFEIQFESIKEEYQYGKPLEIRGNAKTFSGIPLSHAQVNYVITKQDVRWKYFWGYYRNYENFNPIIGTVNTDEKGQFTIVIHPEKSGNKKGIHADYFAVDVSITDMSGETQMANTGVTVATVSHYITTDFAQKDFFEDETVVTKVAVKNYNGERLEKTYHAKLEKLKSPKRLLRDNFKDQVQNYPIYSRAEFEKYFPYDRYDAYDDVNEKDVERLIWEKQAYANKSEDYTLNLGKLATGKYLLTLYNIEGNDTIKTQERIEVWSKKGLKNEQPFLKVLTQEKKVKRNEKAKFYIYSAVPEALVNIFTQDGISPMKHQQIALKNGWMIFESEMPKDKSVSSVNFTFQMMALNDVHTITHTVGIAAEQEPLKIETITMRDKILPGQKEKWVVKILGKGKEKIEAEVLANMYDASLNSFASNTYTWQKFYSFQKYPIKQFRDPLGLKTYYYRKDFRFYDDVMIHPPYFNWWDGESYMYPKRSGKNFNVLYSEMVPAAVAEDLAVRGTSALSRESSDGGDDEQTTVVLGYSKTSVKPKDNPKENKDLEKIPLRKNRQETAFFYPHLKTDAEGNVHFEFTSPEALTKWKLMFLAHTKNGEGAVLEKEVITQKEFSVNPNYPRFLREGDEMKFQTKLSNMTQKSLIGKAQLQILDAKTNEDITEQFGSVKPTDFSLDSEGNTVVHWHLKVPMGVNAVIFKTIAKAGNFSDGEQKDMVILPNRMLVTDAQPIFVKQGQKKTFTLQSLAENTSATAVNVATTLALNTQPIWEVIFALPSLKNAPHQSADVVFNKWFADVLASEIIKANPKVKSVFDAYQNEGLLSSNLEKNEELKQLLLEETPWVLHSENETEQMKKLAALFDVNTMRQSIKTDWETLVQLQNSDGGFSWYQGYPSSYATSLYILKKLGKINQWIGENAREYQNRDEQKMVKRLVAYVDNHIAQHWETNKKWVWTDAVLDYLDTRHYWEAQYPLSAKGQMFKQKVIQQARKAKVKDFTFFGLHRAALLFDAYQLPQVSKKLMTYLKETSTETETQGVYWKQNLNDWGWYSSKTVNHAGVLEAFQKLTPNDSHFIEEMKIALVTQKEVSAWENSRATVEVIFTLLNSGKSWTATGNDKVEIQWGGRAILPSASGIIKQTITQPEIDKDWASVTVAQPNAGIVQGGLYWQYYEDLDKIKSSETHLSITKELYRKVKTTNGEILEKITDKSPLKVGDRVTVRMILNTDRPMEFVHLKDMRAAGFEPINVFSGYRWKNGLGYYESTKDASTNFYIQYLPKGKFVFEYDYICNAAGTFSNGITTLQNYYAPQMNAHSKGVKVQIEE